MFSHIMVGTNDPDRAKAFYDAVLGTLGVPPGFVDKQPDKHRVFWRTKTGVFGVSVPIDGKQACHANGGTVGFACATPEQVHAFHEAGVETRPFFSLISDQAPYRGLGYRAEDTPRAADAFARGLYVSNSPDLTPTDRDLIVDVLRGLEER